MRGLWTRTSSSTAGVYRAAIAAMMAREDETMFWKPLSECKTPAETAHYYAMQSRRDGDFEGANWWAQMAEAYERGQDFWWSVYGGDVRSLGTLF